MLKVERIVWNGKLQHYTSEVLCLPRKVWIGVSSERWKKSCCYYTKSPPPLLQTNVRMGQGLTGKTAGQFVSQHENRSVLTPATVTMRDTYLRTVVDGCRREPLSSLFYPRFYPETPSVKRESCSTISSGITLMHHLSNFGARLG